MSREGTRRPQVELDAAELLVEIAGVLPPEAGRVDMHEVWQIGAFLARFAHEHDDLFGEDALGRLTGSGVTGDLGVSLSGAKGYHHLADREDPELWLSLFEFAPGEATTVHDHATWGVMLAVGGRNHVRLFERADCGDAEPVRLETVREWTLERGGLAWWFDPPRNVHQQEALGDASAYGLVLMGHDPTTRMQRQYDVQTGRTKLVPYLVGPEGSVPTRTLVGRVAAWHVAPHAARVDRERRFPREAFDALAGAGLLGLMTPAEHGGMAGGFTSLVGVCEVLAEACASTSVCFLMHCCGSAAIAAQGDEAQRTRYLAPIARGDTLATIALGGADANAVTVRPDGEGGARLSGRKAFVTGGDDVDVVLVLAEGSMYIVETDVPGVRFEGRWEGLGMTGNNSTTLVLDDVALPRDGLLGEPGGGATLRLEVVRPLFLLGLTAINLGIAEAALVAALDQARCRRRPDGTRRGDAPAIQVRLAEMRCRLDAARALAYDAADKTDWREDDAVPLAMEAKLLACEMSVEVAQQALQVCGGHGYSAALPVERHLRDAHAGRLMTPTADELKSAIGRDLLDAG